MLQFLVERLFDHSTLYLFKGVDEDRVARVVSLQFVGYFTYRHFCDPKVRSQRVIQVSKTYGEVKN